MKDENIWHGLLHAYNVIKYIRKNNMDLHILNFVYCDLWKTVTVQVSEFSILYLQDKMG